MPEPTPDTAESTVSAVLARIDGLRRPYGRHALPVTDRMVDDVLEEAGARPGALTRMRAQRRGVSTLEIALLAEYFGVSDHWLITGDPDPHQVIITAGHGCRYPFAD